MNRPRHRRVVLALGLAVCLTAGAAVLSACGGSSSSSGSGSGGRGGTYRVQTTDFGFSDNFDPTGEYTTNAWGIYRGLLTRTLVGYNMVEGTAGNTLVPDLATALPTPTDGGRTWTFTIKPGVRFSPPVNRAVTSRDVAYAFERIATPALAAQYGFYYSEIQGMDAFASGKAATISGISTPNAQTITFHLTQRTPDFLYRLSLPATAPIPREVAKCFKTPGGYGRDVVASGPYMIQGSASVNISSCSAITPMAGFDPTSKLILVRNPNYNPATDSTAARTALPNSFAFTVNSNSRDIFDRIRAGLVDDSLDTPPASVVAAVHANSSQAGQIHTALADAQKYISMNLTRAPFDDIHVRKAVNLIMDKAGLLQANGGPLFGQIATHIVPNTMYNDAASIAGYDPYPSPNNAGDLAAAQAEMRLSKYDPAHDGMCDASACKNVYTVSASLTQNVNEVPVVQAALAKIGITLNVRSLPPSSATSVVGTVANNVPLALGQGFSKDYADPSTFMVLFQSSSIMPTGNINESLVGLTPALATQVGATIPAGVVIPSIDAGYDTCAAIPVGTVRQNCWIALDKHTMESVVPWVPYLTENAVHIVSSDVTHWGFDQSSDTTAFSHVAVKTTTGS
jgi:peptide/nickel transport system substrate-binding protein